MNLTLHKGKCVFKDKEVTYLGHKLTLEGIKHDDEKVHAIKEMSAPTDKKGVEGHSGKEVVGHGGVLLQDNCPVPYVSRSLTEAESRYAQIEKEVLAVHFSLERFNQYTHEKKVHVESDHKPLKIIVKKS